MLNKEAIAVSQDPLAMPATMVDTVDGVEVWSGPLEHGGKALLFLNGGSGSSPPVGPPKTVSFDVSQLNNTDEMTCRDIWLHGPCAAGATLPTKGNITVQIEQHGVVFMRLTPKTDAVAQSMAARHQLSAEAAVAAAEFAAADAATYHAALHRHDRELVTGPEPELEPEPTIAEPVDGAPASDVDGAAELSAEVGWPMRGYDSTHSGRAPFQGPSSCPTVKWTQALGQGKRHEHNRRENALDPPMIRSDGSVLGRQ